jgi:glycogen synthase
VNGVGGLVDTVVDADTDTRRGTGFVASRPDPIAFLDAWHRANRAVANRTRARAIRTRGMVADWSWEHPAAEHVALYRTVAGLRA